MIFIDLETLQEFISNFGYLNDDVNRLINYSNKTGISSTCTGVNEHNEKNMGVWRIDTGSSKAFESFDSEELSETRQPSVLEILDDNKFNILK